MNRLEDIRRKIHEGTAIVLTAAELKKRICETENGPEVDVVTCGTCGVMSGTYAVLSVPVAPPGVFVKADTITLNGVPAIAGPCPNERLGLVDLIVYGTAHADYRYGGGHLFQDIIADNQIHATVTAGGKTYETDISGHELPHARLFTTRSAFKNYTAIINRAPVSQQTIFSVLPLEGSGTQATVSGCGEINPIENDPDLRFLTPGTPILLNGGSGYVIGQGTRSSPQKPNIAVHGDMTQMDPSLCGGFCTSAGPECLTSIGTAIPVLDVSTLQNLMVRDCDISLPVMDIADRQQVAMSSYDRVWTGTSRAVTYNPEKCLKCDPCAVQSICPVDAIQKSGDINHLTCFCCGTCVNACKEGAYQGSFGCLNLSEGDIPIVLRQSDRRRGLQIARKLQKMIQHHEFLV
jgi:putative methanogenesis marker 16 metalloprotein